jgi:hypothetical protein
MADEKDDTDKGGAGDATGKEKKDDAAADKGGDDKGKKDDAEKGDKGKKDDGNGDDDDAEFNARVDAEVKRRETEAERAKARKEGTTDKKLEATEQQLAETQVELWRTKAALKYGLSDEDAEFLTGKDEAEFMRRAKKLADRLKTSADAAAVKDGDDKKKKEADEIDETPGTPEPTARKGAGNGEGGKLKLGDVSGKVRNNLRGSLGLRVVGEQSK